jgi:hypothetical protein
MISLTVALNSGSSFAQVKSFVSSRFNYQLNIPVKWHISVAKSGVAIAFNYDLSRALPQGLIPEGGVEVYVVPLAAVEPVTEAKTLETWAEGNLSVGHTNVSTAHLPNFSNTDNTPHNILEVEADFRRYEQDEDVQREISFYFTLKGKPFRLMTLFGKDDPKAAYFRATSESIFRSIRSR